MNGKSTKSSRKLWYEKDGLDKNIESEDNEGEVCRKDIKIHAHCEQVVLRNMC